MHVKNAVLHCSYAAPVRVSDIELALSDCVAARATTDVALRPGVVLRADVVRGDVVCIVAVRALVWRVVFCLVVRGVSVAVRAAVVFSVVVVRFDDVVVGDFWRAWALPSRTAARTDVADIKAYATKIRIFFISDLNVSKKANFRASEKMSAI